MGPKSRYKVGAKFGRLTLVELVSGTPGKGEWLCRCDCGKMVTKKSGYFYRGGVPSCGCRAVESIKKVWRDRSRAMDAEIVGKRFGHLVVKRRMRKTAKDSHPWYICRCDCGADTIVRKQNLQTGKTASCGKCVYNPKKPVDNQELLGQTFGEFTVKDIKPNGEFLCQCSCGNYLFKKRSTVMEWRRAVDKGVDNSNLSCGCKRGNLLEFKGEKYNQSRWAEKLGITRQALSWRLKTMPVEKALNLPKQS